MQTMRRRHTLLLVGAAGALIGCGSSPETSSAGATNVDGGTSTSQGGDDAASVRFDVSTPATDGTTTTSEGGAVLAKPYKKLAVGAFDACLLDAEGRVACWGANTEGATANASATSLTVITGLPPVADVVMSNIHSCALTIPGDVYCWGSNVHNQLGHLAGTQGDVMCSSQAPCARSPVKVDGLPKAMAIGTPFAFRTCALVEGGKVVCWGESLGDASVPDTVCPNEAILRCYTKPTELMGIDGLTELAVGWDHICGLKNGNVVCWGPSSQKELSTAACPMPPCNSPVSLAPIATLAEMPSLGVNTTCFRKMNGDVACVGRNDYGQLGHTPNTAGDAICNFGVECNGVPAAVQGLEGSLGLSRTSEWFWCGIAKDRTVLCWGTNGSGELGHPPGSQGETKCSSNYCSPVPSAVPGITGATLVAAGHWMACAVDGNSALWCWGSGTMGAPKRIDP